MILMISQCRRSVVDGRNPRVAQRALLVTALGIVRLHYGMFVSKSNPESNSRDHNLERTLKKTAVYRVLQRTKIILY